MRLKEPSTLRLLVFGRLPLMACPVELKLVSTRAGRHSTGPLRGQGGQLQVVAAVEGEILNLGGVDRSADFAGHGIDGTLPLRP